MIIIYLQKNVNDDIENITLSMIDCRITLSITSKPNIKKKKNEK
jgi:hypothetical protein